MVRKPEIGALTGLRFIAALYVFLFHIHICMPLTDARLISAFLYEGAIGMSLFFMLSGYILAYRYDGPVFSTRSYALNRIARIAPVYWVAAIVTLPWIGTKETWDTVGLIGLNVVALQAWVPPTFGLWNNGASWSISVEAFFYALFPFVLVRLQRASDQARRHLALALYLGAAGLGLSSTVFNPVWGTSVYYVVPLFRLPEFLLGALAYFIGREIDLPRRSLQWLVVAIVAIIAYLALVGAPSSTYVRHHWIVLPVVSMALIVLHRRDEVRLLDNRLMVWLGLVSYCFYSFQVLILIPMWQYRDELAKYPSLVFAAVALAALLFISAITYHLIEKPAREAIRRVARYLASQDALTASAHRLHNRRAAATRT